MTTWYVDTSAAVKLVLHEAETDALSEAVDREDAVLVGSWLLETEMRRTAQREEMLTQEMVTEFLSEVVTYDLPPAIYRSAGLIEGQHLRSLDAIHLAVAVRIGADAVVTYDRQMATAARDLGFKVVAPA